MSANNDPLKPTPFEPAIPTTDATRPTGSASNGDTRPRWLLPALAVLLVSALAVVFWLPDVIDSSDLKKPLRQQPAIDQADGSGSQVSAPARPGAEPVAASPWSDAQQARLRKEAQDVLAELLELQFKLEERGVKQWAGQAFTAAIEAATAGDTLYRERDFSAAKDQYAASLASLQSLQDSIPQQLQQQLDAARTAVAAGDARTATLALDITQLIDPANSEAMALRTRVQQLPALLSLMQDAQQAEQAGDLAAAQQSLQSAADLDALFTPATENLERVSNALQTQRFNTAMTQGYSALDAGRFSEANAAFRNAATLRSGSAEAASALQELAVAQTAAQLKTLKRSALQAEQDERWQDAVADYDRALGIDRSVLFAKQGLARSKPRAQLDEQLQTLLNEPARLANAGVADNAEQLLAQARTTTPAGSRLTDQIEALATALQRATTPVAVTLQSDLQTDVVVYQVARLGQFQQRELQLRPGTYTAVGSRNGYRDVRRSFTVAPGSPSAPISIVCTEPI
tara:strand:+ start:84998 stop:86545 length:1548 start_codon:yes stop_codon:yes gene_type:complete